MAINTTSATPNGDTAAANVGADSATGEATTNVTSTGSDAKAKSGTTADAPKTDAKTEVTETPFDTAAASKAWTVPAVSTKEDAENAKAVELQQKETDQRVADPNKVVTRGPVEGVGGESFVVGVGEETDTLANKVQREDDAQRREDANRIVMRTPDKRVGGMSFDVG